MTNKNQSHGISTLSITVTDHYLLQGSLFKCQQQCYSPIQNKNQLTLWVHLHIVQHTPAAVRISWSQTSSTGRVLLTALNWNTGNLEITHRWLLLHLNHMVFNVLKELQPAYGPSINRMHRRSGAASNMRLNTHSHCGYQR